MPRYNVTIINRENYVVEAKDEKEAEEMAMSGEYETQQLKYKTLRQVPTYIPDFEWSSSIFELSEKYISKDSEIVLSRKLPTNAD